jgi:hypothetical protein
VEAAIEVAGLLKRFGRVQALDCTTFTIRPGDGLRRAPPASASP